MTSINLTQTLADFSIAPQVLGDLALFFTIILLFLTYLGAGVAALTLPSSLRQFGWLIAPYAGYSLLVVVCAASTLAGADVRASLTLALLLATATNIWMLRAGPRSVPLGPVRWWLAMAAMAVPLYAIPAVSMAHNGSTAYVGGQGDLTYVLPVIEWLKNHSGGILSFNSGPTVSPHSIGNPAPLGGWNSPDAELGYPYPVPADAQVTFQRGMVYLQAAMGIVLQRDSWLVYRPTMAFMLSLSVPAIFLLSRHLVRSRLRASLLAALLLAMNGTLYYWISFGHLGQTVAASLLPISLTLTIAAIESREKRAAASAALALSALLVSFYLAITPVLAALLGPSILYLFVKSPDRQKTLSQVVLIIIGVLLLALPEHLKLALALHAGSVTQVEGWNEPDFAPIGDAFGTSLLRRITDLVMGQGQASDSALAAYGFVSGIATAIAGVFALVGVTASGTARVGLYRSMLLGMLGLMAYLRLTSYSYGYSKAQATMTFLVVTAVALGIDWVWERLACGLRSSRGIPRVRASSKPIIAVVLLLLMCGTMAANLALSAYAFWKPVANIWDPRAWGASELVRSLPAGSKVSVSPNILSSPESSFATLYFLRNQVLEGTFSLGGMFGSRVLSLPSTPAHSAGLDSTRNEFEIVGSSEVAPAAGLLPQDRVWAGSIANVYRNPTVGAGLVAVGGPSGSARDLPAQLPLVLQVRSGENLRNSQSANNAMVLVVVFAAEARSDIKASAGQEDVGLQIGPGVSVRSMRVEDGGTVMLEQAGDGRVQLLATYARSADTVEQLEEDYPSVLVAVGHSTRWQDTVSTRFSYLDTGVLAFHSLDIYPANGNSRKAWFELPTYPDKQLRDVDFALDIATMTQVSRLDGQEAQRSSSANPLPDGDYVACFSIWSVRSLVKSIPLYRFRLEGGHMVDFTSFDLMGVWNGESIGDSEK